MIQCFFSGLSRKLYKKTGAQRTPASKYCVVLYLLFPLQDRLAGQIDTALAVNFHTFHHDFVADRDHVFYFLYPFGGELGNVDTKAPKFIMRVTLPV